MYMYSIVYIIYDCMCIHYLRIYYEVHYTTCNELLTLLHALNCLYRFISYYIC